MIRTARLARWIAPVVLIVVLGCKSSESTGGSEATPSAEAAPGEAPLVGSQTCFDAGCACVEWTVGSGPVCGTCGHSHDAPSVDEDDAGE